MENLRWLLLAIGVVVVAGVYLYSRQSSGARKRKRARRAEPRIGGEEPAPAEPDLMEDSFEILVEEMTDVTVPEDFSSFAESVARQSEAAAERAGAAAAEAASQQDPNQKIVALHAAARGSETMRGPDIVRVLDEAGLVHGRYRIFHKHPPTTGGGVNVATTLYSVASMTEPGAIPLEQLESLQVRGLTCFMMLPGSRNGAEVFDDMLATARRVSELLDAELLDEGGSTLTKQAAAHIREEIITFEHRVRQPARS